MIHESVLHPCMNAEKGNYFYYNEPKKRNPFLEIWTELNFRRHREQKPKSKWIKRLKIDLRMIQKVHNKQHTEPNYVDPSHYTCANMRKFLKYDVFPVLSFFHPKFNYNFFFTFKNYL